MAEIYLLSTFLMTVLVIAVALAITRNGQRATPSGQAGRRTGFVEWSGRAAPDRSRIVDLAYNPMAWTVSFVVLAVVFLGGAVLVSGALPSGIEGGAVETGLLAVGGAVLLGYVFFGAFFAARDRMGQTAAAVAVASVTIGVLVLIGVTIALLQA